MSLTLLLAGLALAHPGGHDRLQAITASFEGDCPAQGLLSRGVVYGQMEHHDEALADLRRARECAPKLAGLDREEARILMQLRQWMPAAELLERHLVGSPDNAEARVLLARARMELGEWQAADAAFEAALTDQARAMPDHYLWWADARRSLGDPAGALEAVELGLTRAPNAPGLADRAVQLEAEMGFIDAAVARLDERIQKWPTLLKLWLARGDLLADAGRADEAKASWGEIVERWETLPPRLRNERMRAVRDQATERLKR